ncbi:MAG: hypothetical protein WC718_02160 [Phycisphaerales bacterium]|jgi:hypothetical protein
MIHEFAIEPELAATWGRPAEFRYFVRAFGLGTPRIFSRYPNSWKRLVWEASRPDSDLERKRLEEMLAQLSHVMVKRGADFDPNLAWLRNVVREHARIPFSGILTRDGNAEGPVIGAEHLTSSTAWNCPSGLTCSRTSAAFAAALTPLLRVCRKVAFIDPYFGPEKSRHRRPLQAFLRALTDQRPGTPPDEVILMTSMEKNGTADFFLAESQRQLPGLIPQGMTVVLRRLKERVGGEKLHNRYVLTDIGGILFGVGLDEGDPSHSDDLSLLSADQYLLRCRQYLGPSLEFDTPEPDIRLAGSA